MPEPVHSGQRYLPGLDGLRAVAVLAVIAYHLGLGWAPGGLLGVGVFFTLSGYLITDLLLRSWESRGRLGLAGFWLRRARRLLPALAVMLAVVAAWVTLADRSQLPALRGEVAAAAGYASNWYLIAQHASYFARFGPPSPLGHLWSLAVEEQFYLAWPWLLWLGLWLVPARAGRGQGYRRLAMLTLLLAGASAAEMALCYHPGYDPTRVYEGTDTRAFGLLAGAALAMVWPSRPAAGAAAARRRRLDAAALAGLAVIALLIWRAGEYDRWVYPGGMMALSAATAAVVAAAACPGSRVAQLLSWAPLRELGVRSYGLYLWHFPVIVLTTPPGGGPDPVRAAAQVLLTVGVAILSWRYVEEPVRRGALGRAWARARMPGWRPLPARPRGWAVLGAAGAVAVLAACGLTGLVPASAGTGLAGAARGTGTGGTGLAAAGLASGGRGTGMRAATGLAAAGQAVAGRGTARQGGDGRGPRTSCHAVAHIGDSTSEGMISPAVLPRRGERLTAQYARTGVAVVRLAVSGARSVVETLPHQRNAYQVARRLISHGFRGCWVLALGTNDTADVAAGSPVSRPSRIGQMMALIGRQPVMWVMVKTLLASGPYAESQMELWNAGLRAACARYPDLRVFDWPAMARRSWFIPDGVHYTPAGYAARARLIAGALARAFPRRGRAPGCVVG